MRTSAGRKIPAGEQEISRIQNHGGFIIFGRVIGELAISRAFGMYKFKPCGVTATPFITKKKLDPHHQFIVIACDGLWDVMTAEEVSSFVLENYKNGREVNNIAEALVKKALARHPNDNVTALVIGLLN